MPSPRITAKGSRGSCRTESDDASGGQEAGVSVASDGERGTTANQASAHERLMLKSLAGCGAVVERVVDGDELPRFRLLCKLREGIRVRLSFAIDDEGLIRIKGALATSADVDCQRCPDTVAVGLHTAFSLVVVTNEADAARLSAADDVLEVASFEPTLAEVIEDELMLMLPMQPCVRRNCEKAPPLAYPSDARCRSNPFAPLAVLNKS